jgi:LPS export ABC transporter protein LptC
MVSPRNIRLLLAILVITATIGIVAAIFQKGSKSVPPEPVPRQLPRNIDVALHNARFTEMHDGTVVWVLVAEKAEYDKSGEIAYLSGLRMDFMKNQSSGPIRLTAAKGEYSSKSRNVKLRGKVHVVTGSGASFNSESLDYQASRSRFVTADQVRFRHQRISLSALGMELDRNDQVAHFNKGVEAVVVGQSAK